MSTFAARFSSTAGAPSPAVPGNAAAPQSIPEYGQQAAPSGPRYQDVPKKVKFDVPQYPGEIAATPDTRMANLGKIPGQFYQSPENLTGIVKAARDVTPETKAAIHGSSARPGQIDHILPVWLGGTGSKENLRLLRDQAAVLSPAQAVLLSLYRNPDLSQKYLGRRLDLPEARMWAIRAIDFKPEDVAGLTFKNSTRSELSAPTRDEEVKMAADALKRWQAPVPTGIPKTKSEWGTVLSAINPFSKVSHEAMDKIAAQSVAGARMGEEALSSVSPTLGQIARKARIFSGKMVESATLGYFKPPDDSDLTAAERAAQTAGSVAGMFVGYDKLFGKAMSAVEKLNPKLAAKLFPVAPKLETSAKTYMGRAEFMKSAVKSKFTQFLQRLPANVAVMGAFGQLSRQEDNTLKARAKVLGQSAATGALLSAFKPGITADLGLLWTGSVALDTAFGSDAKTALTNATALTLLHAAGGDTADKVHQAAFDQAQDFRRSKLGGSEPFRPKSSPKTPEEMAQVRSSFDEETWRMLDKVTGDTNLTPDQKESEAFKILLAQNTSFLQSLPKAEREKLAAQNFDSIQQHFEANPGKNYGTVSESSRDVVSKLESTPEKNPKPGEPAVELKTEGVSAPEVSDVVVRDIDKATKEGALVRSKTGLVPAEGARVAIIRNEKLSTTDAPIGEVVLVKDGVPYSLGMAKGDQAAKVLDDLANAGHRATEATVTRVTNDPQTGAPQVQVSVPKTMLDASSELGKREKPKKGEPTPEQIKGAQLALDLRPAVVPEPTGRVSPTTESVPQVPVKEPGTTYVFAKRRPRGEPRERMRPSTSAEQEGARKNVGQASVRAAMDLDVRTGKLKDHVVPAMSKSQLEQAITETAVSLRNPDHPSSTVSDLKDQMRKLFVELEGRVQAENPVDPNNPTANDAVISGYMDKVAADAVAAAHSPYIENRPVDPAIQKRADDIKQKLGITDDREALTEATNQVVMERLAGAAKPEPPMYERLKSAVVPNEPTPGAELPEHLRQFGKKTKTSPTELVRTTKPSEADAMAAVKERMKKLGPEGEPVQPSPEDIKAQEKSIAEDRQKTYSKAKDNMFRRIDDVMRLKKEKFAVGENLRPESEFITNMTKEMNTFLEEESKAITAHKNRFGVDEFGNRIREKTKVSPLEQSGYRGLTEEDIKTLRKEGKAYIHSKYLESEAVHTRYEEDPLVYFDEKTGETRLANWRERNNATQEEDAALKTYKDAVSRGLISGEGDQFAKIVDAYTNGNTDALALNPDFKYVPEFNPLAREAEDAWKQALDRRTPITDTTGDPVIGPDGKPEMYPSLVDTPSNHDAWMRAYVSGDATSHNESVLKHPVIEERIRSAKKPPKKETQFEVLKSRMKPENVFYDKVDPDTGKPLGKAPIKNQVAAWFEKMAQKVEAKDPVQAEVFRTVNKLMAQRYGGKTEAYKWYEQPLENPSALFREDKSLLGTVHLSPGELEVMQRANMGTLLTSTSSDPMVQEVARIAKEESGGDASKIVATLVPNNLIPRSKKFVNVTNIMNEVHNKNTAEGKFLESVAKTDDERASVSDYFRTSNQDYLPKRLDTLLEDFRSFADQVDPTIATIRGGGKTKAMSQYGLPTASVEDAIRGIEQSGHMAQAEEALRQTAEAKGKTIDESSDLMSVVSEEDFDRQDYSFYDAILGGLTNTEVRGDFEKLSPDMKRGGVKGMATQIERLLGGEFDTRVSYEKSKAEKIASGKKEIPALQEELAKVNNVIDSPRTTKSVRISAMEKRRNLEREIRKLRGTPNTSYIPNPAEDYRKLKNTLQGTNDKVPTKIGASRPPKPPSPSPDLLRKLKEKGFSLYPEFESKIKEKTPQ